MNQPQEAEPNMDAPTNHDPNSWLTRVKILFERSVQACSLIIDFSKELAVTEELALEQVIRYGMLPTEMIVAMHNLRQGIEDALLSLAALGVAPELHDQINDIFIENNDDEGADLDLLFLRVVEENDLEGFVPVARIKISAVSGVSSEQYQGTLEYLKEMAQKYQRYDFKNVPKGMAGACWRGDTIADPFMKTDNQEFNNPQDECAAGIDSEELLKYQGMGEEIIEDANIIYGQFCAVGSIYLAAIRK